MDVLWMQRTAEHLHAISRRLEAIENRMTREVAVQATPELAPATMAPEPAVENAVAVAMQEEVVEQAPAAVAPVTVQPSIEVADDHVASQETVEGGPDENLELETW